MPKRIPILYLILFVLILVSIGPLWWYGKIVSDDETERLKTNEKLLQNTITSSMSDELAQRQGNLLTMMSNLASAIAVASGNDLSGDHLGAPELRALLQKFVSSSDYISYATLIGPDSKGKLPYAGKIEIDDFMRRELDHGYAAAREGRIYNGAAMQLGSGKQGQTVTLVSSPIMVEDRFIGMIGVIVNQQPLLNSLQQEASKGGGGLTIYVVDRQGRLVAGSDNLYATGQDMTNFEIVKNFVKQGGNANVTNTMQFSLTGHDAKIDMLGTYSPVLSLGWAVVAQKPQRDAYQGVYEMQSKSRLWMLLAALTVILISMIAARQISHPVKTLTESSRAIAKGDFSKRVRLQSRTEIGELATTFNTMSADLERLVFDLKHAAEENRSLMATVY